MILVTPLGPTLWQHLVTRFGSKAAVWAYNRSGDSLIFLIRVFLMSMAMHYVDDYCAVEPADVAESGFSAFRNLGGLLSVQ